MERRAGGSGASYSAFVGAALVAVLAAAPLAALEIKPHPILTERRLALTRAYAKAHYGLDDAALKDPKLIVIHDTEIATLAATFAAFAPDVLPSARAELKGGGEVNVGVHFVVDRDGTVYSLLPLDVIGRHAIGFNHAAIGVENVAKDASALTGAQVAADAELVADLVKRFPSIRCLIGHHEYQKRDLPHFKLYKELVRSYRPAFKSDPGPAFMRKLRADLARRGIVLER